MDLLSTDRDSPDTVISSSSPESFMFPPAFYMNGLEYIDEDKENRSWSPEIPLLAPIPIRAVPVQQEEKKVDVYDFDDENVKPNDKENKFPFRSKSSAESDPFLLRKLSADSDGFGVRGKPDPLKDLNVAVTLTLTSEAANDINAVLSALSGILKIAIPTSYDILDSPVTPPSDVIEKDKDVKLEDETSAFCRHCDVVVFTAGVRKKTSDLEFLSKEEKETDPSLTPASVTATPSPLTPTSTPSPGDPKPSPLPGLAPSLSPGPAKINETTVKTEPQAIKKEIDWVAEYHKSLPASLKKNIYKSKRSKGHHDVDVKVKRLRSDRWCYWNPDMILPSQYCPPSQKLMGQLLERLETWIRPGPGVTESRSCSLCKEVGDGPTDGVGRLLNVDANVWIHLNCALWSSEVYETVNGGLMNVDNALSRGLTTTCASCRQRGATLNCFRPRCPNVYHVTCARTEKCSFYKDKTVTCPQHVKQGAEVKDGEMKCLSVYRRVFVDREEQKQINSISQSSDQPYRLRIGNLILLNVGTLSPQQLDAFHNPAAIYPVGYTVMRIYWSMRNLGKRCQYVCSIHDSEGRPEFKIIVKEPGWDDVMLVDSTPKGVWMKVLEPIEKLRQNAKHIKVFPNNITGEDMFGLMEPSIVRIIETLPGVETLRDYTIRYPAVESSPADTNWGCVRTEPKTTTSVNRSRILHTSNSTRRPDQTTITGIEPADPYMKQFVHSKTAQYRRMKSEWKNNVYLGTSKIQGLGLFASRDLEKNTMIIEFVGEIVRKQVSRSREKIYRKQNRSVYMFKLDDERTIDSTSNGGIARYMNHSCNPNCVAELVQIDRDPRIIIFARRKIHRGDELCYDYTFEPDDSQGKVVCNCGAHRCKKWIN